MSAIQQNMTYKFNSGDYVSMRIGKVLAVLVLFACIFAKPVYASGEADYEEIYESRPAFSPYYAGVVKRAALERTLEALNYIRRLAGVSDNVMLDDEYIDKAQHAAVLLDAVGKLTHEPDKPSDMDDEFYRLGAAGASGSNILWGSNNAAGLLYWSTESYMNDSDSGNIDRVGHRRWILNPRMRWTGFGVSLRGGFSATYVFPDDVKEVKYFIEHVLGRPHEEGVYHLNVEETRQYDEWCRKAMSDDFIAWPVRKYPHPLSLFGKSIAWSVILNGEVFSSLSGEGSRDVSVRLARVKDGKQWNFSKTESDGYFNIDTAHYGGGECIIFRPSDIDSYNDGEKWHAEISGLVRKIGNISDDVISFDVTFTDELTGYESDYYKEMWQERHNPPQDTEQEQQPVPQPDTDETQGEYPYTPRNEEPYHGDNDEGSSGGCTAAAGLFTVFELLVIPYVKKRTGR